MMDILGCDVCFGRDWPWDRHRGSGIGVWIYTLHRFFRNMWPFHCNMTRWLAYEIASLCTSHQIHSKSETEKHWKVGERIRGCHMSQLSGIHFGSKHSNSSQMDSEEEPKKSHFVYQKNLMTDTEFTSLPPPFLSDQGWMRVNRKKKKKKPWENLHHKTKNVVLTMHRKLTFEKDWL